jgi:para-aminobenzoate synthetase component 1
LDNEVEIQYLGLCDDELEDDFEAIQSQVLHHDLQETTFEIKSHFFYDYKDKVSKMLIQQGNIYEANFCMEFFAENATINPLINSLN